MKFYANKPADKDHCPVTAKYLRKLKEEDENGKKRNPGGSLGSYGGVVKTFKTCPKEIENRGNTENERFYTWLEDHQSAVHNFLPDLDVFLLDTDYYDVALQKWHLYVSWAAGRDSGYFSKNRKNSLNLNGNMQFKCPELLLWMYEASIINQADSQANSFYERLISIKERKRILDADWTQWISDISEAIEEKIQQPAKE